MKFFFPDNRGRSATAASDKADLRDENIYSAIVMAHGGSGQQLIFTNPRGQSIPNLAGSGITIAQNQHKTYTEISTNLTKAGELGASIGDAAIRALGVTIEVAPQGSAVGTAPVIALYGGTMNEVAEINNKTFFRLEVAGKKQIEGPTWAFPATGGSIGSAAAAGVAAPGTLFGIATNGVPGLGRQVKVPIMIARSDTLNGVVGVASGASLVFITTTGGGQETLVTYNLFAAVRGDVR